MHFDDYIPQNSTPAFLKKTDESIMFLGNTFRKKEMWLTKTMVRTHMLVTGSTGSGKTEFLLGLMANVFAWGSGGLYVDGKGDVNVYSKLVALANKFGRRDDLYLLNFNNRTDDNTWSHTLNPLAHISSDALVQLLVDMMDDAGGDGAMWRGRATAMLTGVVRAVVHLRDHQNFHLKISDIREFCGLRAIIDLANPEKYDLPQPLRKSITSYLGSLPGYQADKIYKQSQTTLDQHGYLEMQLSRMLSTLADVYGVIFDQLGPDIDLRDIVENKRILVVLLPAMEKSSDEIANLGKLITGLIRQTIVNLYRKSDWNELDGSGDTLWASPYLKGPPFLCVLDEAGYYLTHGMDLLVAQARSMNVGFIFAAQTVASLFHGNPRVANSIMGNTATKILLGSQLPSSEPTLNFLNMFNRRFAPVDRSAGFSINGIFRRLRGRLRYFMNDPEPMQDRLRNFGAGEMLVVQGGGAAFGQGIYVQASIKDFDGSLAKFQPVRPAVDAMLAILRPAAPGIQDLPASFDSLIKVDKLPPSPGGEVHARAALQALAKTNDEHHSENTDFLFLGE